jgi:hypothetical protein
MITEEELRAVPMTTQMALVVDESNPDVFGVLFKFPTGRNQVWHLEAPRVPIDEAWIKQAIAALLKQIIGDLRDGWSEPKYKRDKRAFQQTNWESVTGGLRRLLGDWAELRKAHYRAMVAPERPQ